MVGGQVDEQLLKDKGQTPEDDIYKSDELYQVRALRKRSWPNTHCAMDVTQWHVLALAAGAPQPLMKRDPSDMAAVAGPQPAWASHGRCTLQRHQLPSTLPLQGSPEGRTGVPRRGSHHQCH